MVRFLKILLLGVLLFSAQVAFAIPNPASVNCIKNNAALVLLDNVGFCVFSDGSYCEEWSYFRNECRLGQWFWPEGVVDYQNLKKYCVVKQGNLAVIELCKHKGAER